MKPASQHQPKDVLITTVIDRGPKARMTTMWPVSIEVDGDQVGQRHFPGVTLSLRQANAIARIVADLEPHQH